MWPDTKGAVLQAGAWKCNTLHLFAAHLSSRAFSTNRNTSLSRTSWDVMRLVAILQIQLWSRPSRADIGRLFLFLVN